MLRIFSHLTTMSTLMNTTEAQVERDYSWYNQMLEGFSEAMGVRLPEVKFKVDDI